jgi:DNA mismatch repair protein MutS2
MMDQAVPDSPDGVLVSADAGTPSALEGGGWLEALEFARVLDAVAGFAAGPLGAASVRARRPVTDLPWIQQELARVEELAALQRNGRGVVAEAVPELTQALGRLRITGAVLDGQELLALRRTLTAGRLVAGELRRVAADAPQSAALEAILPEASLEKRLELAIDEDGALLDSASPALASARSAIRIARDRLVQRLESLLRSVNSEGGVTLRDGRYVIPVPRDLRTRPEGIIHGESASGATLYIEPAAAIQLGNALREAESAAQREELAVLRALSELLRPAAVTIADLHAMCVAVDDLAARVRWSVEVDGHAPAVATAPALVRIVNGRHPLLVVASRESRVSSRESRVSSLSVGDPRLATGDPRLATGDPRLATGDPRLATGDSRLATGDSRLATVVPFDLTLTDGEYTLLLSGPNTGGKSVLLKAVGLFIALAQSGIVPPIGPGCALPVVERIFADIGDRQSIAASLSTFSAHLALLREILDQADDRTLVLLDEIGSGTDPAEGGALAGATLMNLTRRRTLTLATTHLGALKELATHTPGIINGSLQFDAATLRPTYRLLKGVPGRSYGLAIARRLGLPAAVIAEAESQVPDREKSLDALLAAVEQRQRDQEDRAAQLEAKQADLDGLAAALAAQQESLDVRNSNLKRQERDAEKVARAQARQFLLEARETVEAAVAKAEAGASEAAREARRAVEEAAGAQTAALRAMEQQERKPGTLAPALTVGDRVKLESGSTGELVELRGDGKVVVRIGSLKLVVDPATLTPIAGPPGRRAAQPPSRPEVVSEAAAYEVDLRGMTGDEAEQSVIAAMDAAILAEQPYLRVIHGKGTGVVRERVQRIVRQDRRVKTSAYAPSNQGGTGVTIVDFVE